MEKLMLQPCCLFVLSFSPRKHKSTSPNPFNILFVAKFEIITSTYAKLFIDPKGSISPSNINTHTDTHTQCCVLVN